MKKLLKTIGLAIAFGPLFTQAQNALFVPNQGQEDGPYSAQLALSGGDVYFEESAVTYHFYDPDFAHKVHEASHKENPPESIPLSGVVYTQKWNNANVSDGLVSESYPHYYNYFRGNDSTNWRSGVHPGGRLTYPNLYDGISVAYFQNGPDLKHNYYLDAGADYQQIEWTYSGITPTIREDLTLVFKTPLGEVSEFIPRAYQIINGREIDIDIRYVQRKPGVFGFYLQNWDSKYPTVIDPVLNFSTFSGSTVDNWGYTATYDLDGHFYAGGIAFGQGYPTTIGAYDTSFFPGSPAWASVIDITISKFSPNGDSLIYSTYLGGQESDQPHSMIVNDLGELFIYGLTGSPNFPTTAGVYQPIHAQGPPADYVGGYFTYPFGTDIFISKLSSDGSQLLASTFVGGSGVDGINADSVGIAMNYGDGARGEIVLDGFGNPVIVSSSISSDFPVTNSTALAGYQDAVVFKLDANLSILAWSSYYGGVDRDAGYSLDYDISSDKVYITGGTFSSSLPMATGAIQSSNQGGLDGYLAKFNGLTGALEQSTFLGTSDDDQSFFVSLAPNGNPFVFGQSLGGFPAINAGPLHTPDAGMFIQEYSTSLQSIILSMAFGNGSHVIDMVPTAFNVDDCQRIFLSGWNGNTNFFFPFAGAVLGLPTTPDAYDNTSNGSDFYFGVLSPKGDSLIYGTFFGGNANEHVDGGTSRFSPDGIIYQGVCAGCSQGSFPTTAGAWSSTNGSTNCNYGAIKMSFDVQVDANLGIDTNSISQSCDTLIVSFLNYSTSAQLFDWDFGNGNSSTLANPTALFLATGTYTITLIATDTLCNISDTATLTLNNQGGIPPTAQFTPEYISCDATRTLMVNNQSVLSNQYLWDFGDGAQSNLPNPSHSYTNDGTYIVTLIALDSSCLRSDTVQKTVSFNTQPSAPFVTLRTDSCSNGSITPIISNDQGHYQYIWSFGNGVNEIGRYPGYRYLESGTYNIDLIIRDTLCFHEYNYSFSEQLFVANDLVYIPNAFSPNGDGINEELTLSHNECLNLEKLWIFDKWGTIIFETSKPSTEFWDGTYQGKPASQDVYTYKLTGTDIDRTGFVVVLH